ncbi:UDP-2,3-diacylglucosamine diphosphatase [Paludibacterium purpuratum]|uniref:UDP-2,3-diacylglucosamine pyrophosphatase LpxH n=1 Tax=Paludibacterium purpuratum TaxID=1144873 RepID=A0A4R7B173_9NEIS|nr:UDP-2,3-diacylglucosamine diphosphatase [Paludibacterium purpuratum]TDR76659.1 UDP-2,3-diacylglucosamine pyrophosphatase LpxH [Paludibacterium purpuratum]
MQRDEIDLRDRDPALKHRRFRSIWISDVHLGTPGCRADHLLDFLRHHESDYLYLVGDIVDGWQLKKSWYWKQSHNDVVQKVLRKARKGTRVIYIPGNHDEMARQFAGLDFGGIAIRMQAEHITADGKRLLVTHGDEFDGVIQYAKWLAYLGDSLYTLILQLNRGYNWCRMKLGLPYWSLSQYLKHKVKNAVNFISQFEKILADKARHLGYDGVICGHIHKPEIRDLDGTLYGNSGDWVESLSALVESADGTLSVVYWTHLLSDAPASLPEQEPVQENVCAS